VALEYLLNLGKNKEVGKKMIQEVLERAGQIERFQILEKIEFWQPDPTATIEKSIEEQIEGSFIDNKKPTDKKAN
jgi:hypothetical protein